MPEVEAVGEEADPPQRGDGEGAGRPPLRDEDDVGEDDGDADGDGEEAAVEERRLVAADGRHRREEPDAGDGGGHAEGDAEAGREFEPAAAPSGEQRRQHGAGEHDLHPGVGAEVRPALTPAGLEEGPHRRRRQQRADAGDDADGHVQRRPQAGQAPDHQRPRQVELLLDGERPRVAKDRRRGRRLEVVRARLDVAPVGDVEEGGDGVLAEPGEGATRRQQGGVEPGGGDHQQERGQEAAGPARPEPSEVDGAGAAALVEQERRDQQPAQDEEGVDAEEPALGPGHPTVEQQHGDDGDAPDPVERGHVAPPGDAVVTDALVGAGVRDRLGADQRLPFVAVASGAYEGPSIRDGARAADARRRAPGAAGPALLVAR